LLTDYDDRIVTYNEEESIPNWNEKLVGAGVKVREIQTKLPTLEDLFIELTEGETID
jgi:ABC-2 type transport system ATP-binding protein